MYFGTNPLKGMMQRCMTCGLQTVYTSKAGNMNLAPRSIVFQWILVAWQMIKKDNIIESFKDAALI